MALAPSKFPEAKLPPGHPFFDLIEEAYVVFNRPKPTSTGVCTYCCMDEDIEDDFFNPPVAYLPLRYVRDWYSGAYDPEYMPKETWGYLLPRVLEILAAGEDPSAVALEVSLNRFDTGNSDNWNPREWKVLDAFQRMYLRQSIEGGPNRLDDVLCMFSLAGWPLEDLLEQVANTPDDVLAQKLWRDWCDCLPGRESIWVTAFWSMGCSSGAMKFYTSQALCDRMTALALGDATDPDLAAKASAVVTVIETNAGGNGG